MKKLYTTPEYKVWQARKLWIIDRKRKRKHTRHRKEGNQNTKITERFIFKPPVYAPSDSRLIENTEACLLFFRNIRSEDNINYYKNRRIVVFSLEEVTEIDYGTISILTAISDELKFNNIILKGDFPKNEICKQFIIDSGFLDHMVDDRNQKFPKAEKSDLIFFEKGSGSLSEEYNRKISEMVSKVVNHLTGEPNHFLPVKTIILEICGNSIEWGGTDSEEWLLGLKYEEGMEEGKVIFTLTDVGKGILKTLYRKFGLKLKDKFDNKSSLEILEGAFIRKYGSTTQEVNRNKGLPAVKAKSDQGSIRNLKVLTNNVILHFDHNDLSKTFSPGSARFKGTYYQWEMTKECINNIIVN